MNVGGPRAGVAPDINITPLIDVVLVLLIIFMVLVPSTVKQLTAALPRQEEAAAPTAGPPQIVLKVDAAGQVTLDGRPLPPAELPAILRARLAGDVRKVVFFDVDDGAAYGPVVELMDLVRGAGARTLAVVTPP